jgi:hypothetical protein
VTVWGVVAAVGEAKVLEGGWGNTCGRWGTRHTHTRRTELERATKMSETGLRGGSRAPPCPQSEDQAVRAYCTVKPLCEAITAVNAEPEASMYLTFTREAATEEESPPLAWSPQVTTLPSSLIAANATWFA